MAETNPDFGDVDVSERPTDEIKDAHVVEVVKGTRAEIFLDDETDVADADEPQYGEWSDELVQVELEVETEDGSLTVYDTLRYYDNPSDRSAFGKYVNKYGAPSQGQSVKVDFDSDGEAEVRGIRN